MILRDGAEVEVPIEQVAKGDVFVVRPGEHIPVDGLEADARGRVKVGKDFSTSLDGVYAGGDAVTGAATLMKAAAAGKDAAAAIFAGLE